MDNATYDVLNLPPINTNDTYSTLETIPTKNYEAKRNEGYGMKGAEQNNSNGTPNKNNKPLLVVLIIMMAILLLISIASLAMSVAAYKQSKSEQPIVQTQQRNADNDITATQTLLATTCSNISQMLFQIDNRVNALTSLLLQNTDMEPQPNCGPGLWYRVAHLNMSDPSQQCPSVWREYDEIRACGRPDSSGGSCATKCYLTGNQYSRVCGRVIGHPFETTDAFRPSGENFDGINITSGAQRTHVWSYVTGHRNSDCPCSSTSTPQSIGNRYYCESGTQTDANNPLWDGQQCYHECCAGPGTNSSPPWFSVQLPAPTTDMIEVSICADQRTNDEDILIGLLEIFVQ